jgi:hypothetical protein
MKGPRGRAGPARDCRQLGQPAVSLPIWSCSVWGLPCLRALQPERCALTAPFHPYPRACARWRYRLCGTSRPGALTRQSRTLSGTLPCGVRTFLSRTTSARQRPSSPPAWLILRELCFEGLKAAPIQSDIAAGISIEPILTIYVIPLSGRKHQVTVHRSFEARFLRQSPVGTIPAFSTIRITVLCGARVRCTMPFGTTKPCPGTSSTMRSSRSMSSLPSTT